MMMRRTRESGMALVSAMLVLTLMSALLIGFLAVVTADQRAGGVNRDQTQAYAASHAGLEKLTADLGQLFGKNFSPTGAQIDDLEKTPPTLPGIAFKNPNDSVGYQIDYIDDEPEGAPDGKPDVLDKEGTPIAEGPYQGLVGIITPYEITVTARTTGNAEVRMRRQMQTVAIPVFQFGIFAENDQSFFAGPNFSFGGRVHTNKNLYLKQDGTATLYLADKVTAVGDVIRTHLANGQTTHKGYVRLALDSKCPKEGTFTAGTCLLMGEANCEGKLCYGSREGDLTSPKNDKWTTFSIGDSHSFIRNGDTGAKRLDLPLVSDGAEPIDLIRRAKPTEEKTSPIYGQRFYGMASLRILLSDTAEQITALKDVVATPIRLAGLFTRDTSVPGVIAADRPFAESNGDSTQGYRTADKTPLIDGYIAIERQTPTGEWKDVTKEILSLGFIGRNLSTRTLNEPPVPGTDLNAVDPCRTEPHANAIIRVQRFRDAPRKTDGTPSGNCKGDETKATNYWPNTLYDAREGALRDKGGVSDNVFWSGVMHYVELDVANLKKWLEGTTGKTGTQTMHTTGYVVYFSDRRTNVNPGLSTTDKATGELGWEDNINRESSTGTPNDAWDGPYQEMVKGTLETFYAEDVNRSRGDKPEVYGNIPQVVNPLSGWDASKYFLWKDPVSATVARANRAVFFRRALKVVNGGRGQLPANPDNLSQGLTIASENPVYVQGNFNACAPSTAANAANEWSPDCVGGIGFGSQADNDHVSAAIVADAVTVLSNAWNDIRSFINPHRVDEAGYRYLHEPKARQPVTTWYRMGIIGGKGINFKRPTYSPTDDHNDFGTDGGAHNFIRYLEAWNIDPDAGSPPTPVGVDLPAPVLNYRGSLVSFYTSRQAVGIYKCCDVVYAPPKRGYNFDVEFLKPELLPPRTPMFRDVNTLTFRQILRPTEQ